MGWTGSCQLPDRSGERVSLHQLWRPERLRGGHGNSRKFEEITSHHRSPQYTSVNHWDPIGLELRCPSRLAQTSMMRCESWFFGVSDSKWNLSQHDVGEWESVWFNLWDLKSPFLWESQCEVAENLAGFNNRFDGPFNFAADHVMPGSFALHVCEAWLLDVLHIWVVSCHDITVLYCFVLFCNIA